MKKFEFFSLFSLCVCVCVCVYFPAVTVWSQIHRQIPSGLECISADLRGDHLLFSHSTHQFIFPSSLSQIRCSQSRPLSHSSLTPLSLPLLPGPCGIRPLSACFCQCGPFDSQQSVGLIKGLAYLCMSICHLFSSYSRFMGVISWNSTNIHPLWQILRVCAGRNM